MEWQNNRPAPRRPARLVRVYTALAALALSALLTGCLAWAHTPAAGAQERFEGQWLVEFRPDDAKPVLTLSYRESRRDTAGGSHESNWSSSHSVGLEKLQGLSREQAFSAAGTNVRFDLRREAGTFACEGWFRQGKGSGHFTFVPDQGFASELGRRGLGSPDERQLFALARADVGLALLDELRAQGYERPTLEQLVRMGDHGVHADYVRGMGGMGYRLGSIDELVRMRDHGVGPDFVRELREFGYRDLSAEDLVRARDHGVGSSFIREIQTAGYQAPPLDGLVRIRDHGVTASYIKGLRDEGYDSLALEQLVRMRDHGVTVEFVKELRELGYTRLSVEQLVRMRDHGVTPSFIRRARSRATAPTVDELIYMRDRGEY